jgi:hypothetical protein
MGCRFRSTGCPMAGSSPRRRVELTGPDLSPYRATGQPVNEIVVDARGRAWVDMPGSMPWEEPKPGNVTVVLCESTARAR